MPSTVPAPVSSVVVPFEFESYGVKVKIDSNEQEMVDEAEVLARRVLLNRLSPIKDVEPEVVFRLTRTKSGTYRIFQNSVDLGSGRSRRKFFKFFDSILRVAIGENAPDRVFLHAGVVGWKGKAIVIPADSFKGKSTLVTELVRNGATYISDEFAVIDENGLVHPFERPISRRTSDGKYKAYEISVDDIGGSNEAGPIPIGMVLITEYVENHRWSPKILTAGQGVLAMIPFTLSISRRPEFAIRVLNIVANRAIITSSRRGTVEKFTKTLLNFVDKHVD